MTERESDQARGAVQLIELGTEIAGGVAGTAVGFVSAGPAGALLGAAAAPVLTSVLKKIGAEIRERVLSRREEVRAGAALAFAAAKAKANVDAGMPLRDDGFFEASASDRASAEEIVEGALIVAQREHEEKKIRLYGNLIGNLPFHPEIDRAGANLLLRVAEHLSYQQLVILAIVMNKQQVPLRQSSFAGAQMSYAQIAAVQEAFQLYTDGLLNGSGEVILDMGGLVPSKLAIQGTGVHLYVLMELWTIATSDMARVAALLR